MLGKEKEYETKDTRGGTIAIRRNKGLSAGATDHVEASSARGDRVYGAPDNDNCDARNGGQKQKQGSKDGWLKEWQ